MRIQSQNYSSVSMMDYVSKAHGVLGIVTSRRTEGGIQCRLSVLYERLRMADLEHEMVWLDTLF